MKYSTLTAFLGTFVSHPVAVRLMESDLYKVQINETPGCLCSISSVAFRSSLQQCNVLTRPSSSCLFLSLCLIQEAWSSTSVKFEQLSLACQLLDLLDHLATSSAVDRAGILNLDERAGGRVANFR